MAIALLKEAFKNGIIIDRRGVPCQPIPWLKDRETLLANTSMQNTTPYPVTLSIDYPDRCLNRLTSFFRPFVALPIVILLTLISGPGASNNFPYFPSCGGLVFIATALMLLLRQKYPRWWFDWNVALMKFSMRVCAYLLLLDDKYPSTDEEQAVHIEISYPDAKTLSPGMPLVKWFLAIPHYIVLGVLVVAATVCVIIAWFAILFTG
ncbi:MAG: hypothetical protein ACHQM6_09345, partial [Candidatus Kapaibacterium sp.]